MPPETTRKRYWTRQRRIIALQLFLIVALLSVLAGSNAVRAIGKERANETSASNAPAEPHPAQQQEPFKEVAIHARAAFVWDIAAHRKLYGKNEYEHLPLASVTKMMTALVAKETLSDNDIVRVSKEALRAEGDSGLLLGEEWTAKDLIAFALISSSNDAASALAQTAGGRLDPSATTSEAARAAFLAQMNSKARSIGLLDTIYRNETGLDISEKVSGGEGTARDMAMLYEYLWRKHPDLFAATAQPETTFVSRDGKIHLAKNTNHSVAHIPGIIGSKTGYTDLAGGNLVIVTDIGFGRPIVIAVLGSTREERFTDVEKLREAAVSAITGISDMPTPEH